MNQQANTQTNTQHDIRIRLDNGNWVSAYPYQQLAYLEYKQQSINTYSENPLIYNSNGYKFTIQRDDNNAHKPTYLIRENGSKVPIIDWNDIKVFLVDIERPAWYNARNYQMWSFINYMYNQEEISYYKSSDIENTQINNTGFNNTGFNNIGFNNIGFNNIGFNNTESNFYHTIPNEYSNTNIIFSILRTESGATYYQKYNNNVRVRISDSELARRSYTGYFNRMTCDIGMIISPVSNLMSNLMSNPVSNLVSNTNSYLQIPLNVNIEHTIDESIMCVICNDIKQNIIFKPCNHTHTCSECYIHLSKPRECHICKQFINEIAII